MGWFAELSSLSNIDKDRVLSGGLAICPSSTFSVEVELALPEPSWNLAGRLYIIDNDTESILYFTQKILLRYKNLVITNFYTGDMPHPNLVKFVFIPVHWVIRAGYSYHIYRYIE
ncbi:MAG: hypothetical protein F6K17_17565 [Okeania sp. SIO3C4]|nr:hypothetical protein [Okeania sp. SIO3C4]